jgi:hypothetical protein
LERGPGLFQSFWYGDALSPYEKACIRSFVDHGHRYVLYTYRRDLHVPTGVECCDAAPLIAPELYFTYGPGDGAGSHALFSNLFRYKLLAEQGGWWVDTDVVCLGREIPQCEIFCAYQESGSINGAVLHLPKGHPVACEAYERTFAVRERARWGEVGPELITALIEAYGLAGLVQPMPVCYPVHYTEAIDLLRPSRAHLLRERVRGALFLHLWNEVFRREQVDKTRLPPAGSLLREIFDRHPVDGWTGEYQRDDLEKPRQIRDLEATVRTRTEERDRLDRERASLTTHAQALERELAALRNSTSWRLTQPLRWLGKVFGTGRDSA